MLLVGVMYAPMPIYKLWLLRFSARELGLFGVLVALLAGVLATRTAGRVLAAVFGLLAALPLLATLPVFFKQHLGFSLRQYLTFSAPTATVKVTELALDDGLPDLRVDLYEGKAPAPRPFVIVIHGGSWQHGDKGDAKQVSQALAMAGFTVADLRYRLSPEHRFPAAVQDVKCALGRLREKARTLDLDPERAALLGRSAGGQLALLAAFSAGDPSLPPACAVADNQVRAVVAIYPFTDQRRAYEMPPLFDPEETRAVLVAHFGGSPENVPAAYDRSNPAFYIAPRAQKSLPKALFLHGSGDTLVPSWHSDRLAAALAAAGQPATLVKIPLAEHAFDFRPGGAGEQLERELVPKFLAEQLSVKR